MGKRSDFMRRARDFYPTPLKAALPLIKHLPARFNYVEPCAGNGALVGHLAANGGACVGAHDIEPQTGNIEQADAFDLTEEQVEGADYIITNPPWPAAHGRGEPTIGLIHSLAAKKPTWLLLSSDFAFNGYFAKVAPICVKIVAVGRVSWMQNGTSGMDNAAWYLFDADHVGSTRFFGRAT